MSLRAWVEKNLFATVVIAVSAAGTTLSFATYFHVQSMDALRRENAIYTEQLKARLAGIERHVGSGERTVFDVSRLMIQASSVGTLGPAYRNIADGAVFVDVPADGRWTYSLTSEADLMSSMFPTPGDRQSSNPIFHERNIHLWRQANALTLNGRGILATFFPMVFVQVVDNAHTESALTRIAAGADAPMIETSERAAQRALDRVAAPSMGTQPGQIPLQSTTEAERMLSTLYRGNVSLNVLISSLNGNIALAALIPNARSEIGTIEKRGNVIYVQSRLIVGENRQGALANGSAVIASETFLVTTPTKTILVRILIPSRDGRSDAFEWATRFLGGLRIPLGEGG